MSAYLTDPYSVNFSEGQTREKCKPPPEVSVTFFGGIFLKDYHYVRYTQNIGQKSGPESSSGEERSFDNFFIGPGYEVSALI